MVRARRAWWPALVVAMVATAAVGVWPRDSHVRAQTAIAHPALRKIAEFELPGPPRQALRLSDAEAAEYREYIEYLQSLGCLTGSVEQIELDELQGVRGLHALRVGIDLASPRLENPVNFEHLGALR